VPIPTLLPFWGHDRNDREHCQANIATARAMPASPIGPGLMSSDRAPAAFECLAIALMTCVTLFVTEGIWGEGIRARTGMSRWSLSAIGREMAAKAARTTCQKQHREFSARYRFC
jgi:hypothetical protein